MSSDRSQSRVVGDRSSGRSSTPTIGLLVSPRSGNSVDPSSKSEGEAVGVDGEFDAEADAACVALLEDEHAGVPRGKSDMIGQASDKGDDSTTTSRLYRIVTANWTKDDPPRLPSWQHIRLRIFTRPSRGEASSEREQDCTDDHLRLCDGPAVVRFLKFLVITIIFICAAHQIVRWMDLEHDPNYSIHDFFLYDLNRVCLDVMSYFIIGRLFQRQGVDCFYPFIIPMILGCIYPSWTATATFMQHSLSMYEVVCRWPWQLFLFVFFIILCCTLVIVMHVCEAVKQGLILSRIVELTIIILIFVAPYASDPNFHFHHWYASWMLGMNANMNKKWSSATLAYLWGQYINGIAVWGRDPILGCSYSYYLSTDFRCDYMKCYEDGKGHGGYKPFNPPDWHNCSATGSNLP